MEEPRWLSADEQQVWRAFTAATKLVFSQLDRQLQRDSDVSLAHYQIFVALSEAPGHRMRMSELAEFTRFSKSRLSHAVSRLEQQGWVRRRECPADRRGAYAELTDEGFDVLVHAAPGHVEEVRTLLFDTLTSEQIQQLGEITSLITSSAKKTRSNS